MMGRWARLCAVVLGAIAGRTGAQAMPLPGIPPVLAEAMHGVSGARIADHTNFLASDLLGGRGVNSRGGRIAAAYIATQFALDGLRPAGDHGGYLQTFKVRQIQTDPQTQLGLVPAAGTPIPLKYGDDALVIDQTGAARSRFDAPLVFVGYGIDDAATGRDDFRGADLKGKVALMFEGAPPGAPAPRGLNLPDRDAVSAAAKFGQAARRGAVGVLLIHDDEAPGQSWSTLQGVLQQGLDFAVDDPQPRLKAAGWIQEDVAQVLFAAAGQSLEAARKAAISDHFRAAALPVQLHADVVSEVTDGTAANVVGLLPGRQPGTPRRVTLYSAHYNHLGHGADGGTAYDGAVNNASGVGMLLELARAAAIAARRPPHAMLFVATAGSGSPGEVPLGMDDLARHLPVAARDIALGMDFDTVVPLGEVESLVVSGAHAVRYAPLVRRVAGDLGLRLAPDDRPLVSARILDQILPLARAGVPVVTINQGFAFRHHARQWGQAQLQSYRLTRDQQADDRFLADMNFTGSATLVRYALALGWTIGLQKPARPIAKPAAIQDTPQPARSESTCSGC